MTEQWRTRSPEGSFRRRSGGRDRQGAPQGSFGGPAQEDLELVGTNCHPRGSSCHAEERESTRQRDGGGVERGGGRGQGPHPRRADPHGRAHHCDEVAAKHRAADARPRRRRPEFRDPYRPEPLVRGWRKPGRAVRPVAGLQGDQGRGRTRPELVERPGRRRVATPDAEGHDAGGRRRPRVRHWRRAHPGPAGGPGRRGDAVPAAHASRICCCPARRPAPWSDTRSKGPRLSAAAGVAEAGTKPESTLAFSTRDEPIKKIATTHQHQRRASRGRARRSRRSSTGASACS